MTQQMRIGEETMPKAIVLLQFAIASPIRGIGGRWSVVNWDENWVKRVGGSETGLCME
jgi:hypothetical protein